MPALGRMPRAGRGRSRGTGDRRPDDRHRRYDLEEDSIWSLGIGCSGAVDIRIERIEDDPISRALAGGAGTRRRRPCWSRRWRAPRADCSSGEPTSSGGSRHRARPRGDRAARASGCSAPHPASGPERDRRRSCSSRSAASRRAWSVFGAGQDAEPLARQGWELGFDVTVVDVREAFLPPERFPHATLVAGRSSASSRSGCALTARSFVVIMNHHLERDRECLRFALESAAPYVGVLGPRSRFRSCSARTAKEGYVPPTGRCCSPSAQSHGAGAGRRDARRDRGVDSRGDRRAATRVRRGIPQRPRDQPSSSRRQRALARS